MACSESRTFRRLLGFIPVCIVGGFVLTFAMDEPEGGIVFFSFAGAIIVFAVLVLFVYPKIGNYTESRRYAKASSKRVLNDPHLQKIGVEKAMDDPILPNYLAFRDAVLHGQLDDKKIKKAEKQARKDAKRSKK